MLGLFKKEYMALVGGAYGTYKLERLDSKMLKKGQFSVPLVALFTYKEYKEALKRAKGVMAKQKIREYVEVMNR